MRTILRQSRTDIDRIDKNIINFLARRARVSGKIGALKKARRIALRDKGREAELFAVRVKKGVSKGLSPSFVKKLFKLIHDESVRIQKSV
jgi:chorismate mutase